MCGFTGFISYTNRINSSSLIKMTNTIKHRGPDGEGFTGIADFEELFFEENNAIKRSIDLHIGIGFRRLAIRDLSIAGNQPMFSHKRDICLVFNGEIYNSFDLKEIAKRDSYHFKSSSDTEIILAIYQIKGIEFLLENLDGMYSIIIFDIRTKKILFIRDHLGIKPLYFYKNEKFLLFGSEIKSFTSFPEYQFEIEKDKLDEFLLFRSNLNEWDSFQKNIFELPPGSFIEIPINKNLDINNFIPKYYYKLPNWNDTQTNRISIFELISETVKQQMISDVPVGSQLSGGVDSSIISYYAKKFNPNINLFSVIFDEQEFSEEKYIDYVSTKLELDIYKVIAPTNEFISLAPNIIYHLDHPMMHPSSVGLWKLSKLASKFVKVLLSGEGADELAGGYSRFFLTNVFGQRINSLLRIIGSKIKVKKLNTFGSYEDNYRNYLSFTYFNRTTINKLIMPDFLEDRAINLRYKRLRSYGKSFLNSIFDYEMQSYLPALLIRQDKICMANSVENRVPFLGRKFIESFRASQLPNKCLSLNLDFKSSKMITKSTKVPFKKVSKKLYGDKFTYRKKLGFGFPIDQIFDSKNSDEIFF